MKRIFLLIFFCEILFLFSCVTSLPMSKKQAQIRDYTNTHIVLHARVKTFQLNRVTFTPDTLKGYLSRYRSHQGDFVHVFTLTEIVDEPKKRQEIYYELPTNEIDKIETWHTKENEFNETEMMIWIVLECLLPS